jgi:group I intron endonuclease
MFCIYVFSDEWGIPKYIGKAKCFKTRIKQHLNRDRFIYKSWFYNWLNKQIANNKEFFIDILEEVNQDNHVEREKYWIKHVKENGYQLTNMTDGGDGNNNQVFNEETREKHRIRMTGRVFSEETRKLISQKLTGKTVSQETRKKLSDLNKGKPCSFIVREKLSQKVNQYDLDGNFIKIFNSLTEAANSINARKSSLSNAIKQKKVKKFRGYLWEIQLKINKN